MDQPNDAPPNHAPRDAGTLVERGRAEVFHRLGSFENSKGNRFHQENMISEIKDPLLIGGYPKLICASKNTGKGFHFKFAPLEVAPSKLLQLTAMITTSTITFMIRSSPGGLMTDTPNFLGRTTNWMCFRI